MARGKIQGYVERGGQTVTIDNRTSTTNVQRSFPGATVSVFNAGTATPSTIFSDEGGTPKANPFTSDTDGHWFFWADQGRYDVQFSGAGIDPTFTLFGLETIISTTALSDPGSNGVVVRTSSGVTVARTITGTTSAITVTDGNGVAGNPTINLDVNLNFTGKTITAGDYVSPGITNFQNATHLHADASGGGQLNATNVFNAGTVPVARLPVMVGATGVSPGVAGLVPAPAAGEDDLFLRGDGTWQAAGGGGGGTPSSPNLSLQYNNGGVFGGVTGTSSDGTQVTWTDGVLRATSPRITSNIKDTNGNAIITLNALGSAVNNLQVANAAAGGHVVLSAIGVSTDINIVLTPKGAGIIDTAGNFRIINNAPQITLVDANDTKTVRINLNGANWDFTNDTLGTVPLRIDTTNNNISTVASLIINNGAIFIASSNPAITFDDTAGTDAKIDHDAGLLRFGTTAANQFWLNVDTGVVFFTQLPDIPTTTPTTSGQVVSKQTLDNAELPFSVNWFEFDPSASTTSAEDRPGFLVPDNVVGATITKALISFSAGSALAGGDNIVFTFRRRTSGGGASDWASATLTSSHAIQNVHTFDITNQALSAADRITYFIASRTGTINPRALTLSLQGVWKRTNP